METSEGKVETAEGEVETYECEVETSASEVETSEGKIVAIVFWDGEGILLGDFFERDTAMNCERYEQTLNKLQQ